MFLGLPDPHPDPLVRGRFGSEDPDPHPDPLARGTDPRIPIRAKMSRIPQQWQKACLPDFESSSAVSFLTSSARLPIRIVRSVPLTNGFGCGSGSLPKCHGSPKSLLALSFLTSSARRVASGSVSKRYGSDDPDPCKNVTDPQQHWQKAYLPDLESSSALSFLTSSARRVASWNFSSSFAFSSRTTGSCVIIPCYLVRKTSKGLNTDA
jgi:hypothetical protein